MISIRALGPFFGIALVAAAIGCNGSIATVPSEQDPSLSSKDDKTTTEKGPTDPVPCPAVMIQCKPGERVVDLNGDGCALECEPVSCPPVMPNCKPGEKAADTNGDGCALECVACSPLPCAFGLTPFDSDGDGCPDTCK